MSGTIKVLPLGEGAAVISGPVRAKLEGMGLPIGSYDVMIAGHAMRHGAKRVNWAAP
jgi:predicted nucleic acid-binding protein